MKYSKSLFLLIACMLLFMAACAKDDEQATADKADEELEILNETDMPIVKEEINLDFFAGQAPATNPDWNDVLIFNEYEEMTNININWEMVPHETLAEKKNLALAGGSLPDAFHSASMNITDLSKYGEQGVFIPLNDLIDKYAPNFKKILDENPAIKESITLSDGNIYAFPMISNPDFLSHRLQARPFINKVWLDELGLDMPETTDEYYNFLKAVKEQGPSNGEVEEVPFGGPYLDTLIAYLRGSFGLANRGGSNPFIDLDPETEEMRFYPVSEQYKELLEYLHKLYDEELIEQNVYSIEHHQFLANLSEGKYGSVVWFAPEEVAGKEKGKDYVGMPVLEGPNGEKTLTQLGVPVLNPGAFVITSANEYPAATVRWIDHFYGQEGMELFFMGIEGETYEINEDGEMQFMDHILNSKDGLTFEEEAAKYLTFPGGGFPTMVSEGLFQGTASAPQSLEAVTKLENNVIKDEDIWPILSHTKEENDELQGYGADIEKYVNEMTDKFISGSEPLSKWDEYVSEIEKMGLEDYLELKNNALQRQLDQ